MGVEFLILQQPDCLLPLDTGVLVHRYKGDPGLCAFLQDNHKFSSYAEL
jgi:hypothetical protein